MPYKPTKLYYTTVGYSKSACSAESIKRERIKAPFTLAGNFNGQTEVFSKEQNLKGKILNCFTIYHTGLLKSIRSVYLALKNA